MGGGHRQNSGAGRWPAGSDHRLRRNPYAYCPFLSGQDSLWLKRRMRAYRRVGARLSRTLRVAGRPVML
jgi:hypothetical protein